ncbi:hypothetical protein [Pseudobacteriovorax antillogorgiicola]|nr:hypothetical protein [Pseudobacteriovorax antillogorgiicola]
MEKVKSWENFEDLIRLKGEGSHVSEPFIEYQNHGLKVGDIMIPMSHRPKTAQLVRIFFEQSEHFLSKDQMIELVYGRSMGSLSPRMKQSLHQNLIKLVSRSRTFLTEACRMKGADHIKWFYFDREIQKWALYHV